MKSFEFGRVKEVHLEGLADFELIVDAHHGDQNASSVVVSGDGAGAVTVVADGDIVTVQGEDSAPSRARSVAMQGTFVTGNVAIPVMTAPREPLRIRYGGMGPAPVTIEVALPPGERVVLRGPFQTVTTAAPLTRSGGELHGSSVTRARHSKAEELREQAKQDRSDGTLAGAIRGHVREEEARRLLDDGSAEERVK